MTISPGLRVDGVWLAGSGLPYSDLTWTDRADGGNLEASWSIVLPYGSRPAPLYRGALVEVFLGTARRWYGEIATCDWDGGTFTAEGMSQRAYDFVARTAANQTTSAPDTGVDAAIAFDGWRVTKGNVSTTPLVAGNVTDDLNTVGALLDQSSLNAGLRWGVGADGVVRTYAAPTVYDYVLAPGIIELGESTEDRFSRVVARYIDSSSGVRSIAYGNGTGVVAHHFEDLTNLGPLSLAVASAIAQAVMERASSSPGWTNGVDVTSAQLLTPGGLPADLASVTANQMVRALVVGDNGQQFRDLVIGETKYTAGADVLSLSPVNKTTENFAEVIEDTYTRITGLPVAA